MIFNLDFRLLTTILTTNFVQKGVYRVLNVDEPTGNDVRKIGDGAYVVLRPSRVALMPYVCD